MKILITGIPGMGKTTFGDYLRDIHGFVHINFEDGVSLDNFAQNPDLFLTKYANNKNVVITWGFVPDDMQTQMVKFIDSNGFKLIWFDGDRASAFREYTKTGKPKDLFDLQISRIDSSNVIKKINPRIINTLDDQGEFRDSNEVLEELI